MKLFDEFLNVFFDELEKKAKELSKENEKTERESTNVETDEMSSEVIRKVDGQDYSVASSVHCVNDKNGSSYEISYTFIKAKKADFASVNENVYNICDAFVTLFKAMNPSCATVLIKFDDTCDDSFNNMTFVWNNETCELMNGKCVYDTRTRCFVEPTNGSEPVQVKDEKESAECDKTSDTTYKTSDEESRKKMAFNLKSSIDKKMEETLNVEDDELSCENCNVVFCPEVALDLLCDYINDEDDHMYNPIFDDYNKAVAIEVYASDLHSPDDGNAEYIYHNESFLLDRFCNDVCEKLGFSKAIWTVDRDNTGKDDILDENIADIVFTLYF